MIQSCDSTCQYNGNLYAVNSIVNQGPPTLGMCNISRHDGDFITVHMCTNINDTSATWGDGDTQCFYQLKSILVKRLKS